MTRRAGAGPVWAEAWRGEQAAHVRRPGVRGEKCGNLQAAPAAAGPTHLLCFRACCPEVRREECQSWRCQGFQPGP